MKVGIYYKVKTEYHIETINKFISLLGEKYISYEISEEAKFTDIDAIVVFGGDGTLLNVVQTAVEKDVPIYAVKCSDRGFLTAFSDSELSEAVDCILKRDGYSEHSLISVKCNGREYYGLNDVVIERVMGESELSNALRSNVYLDDTHLGKYISDGLIVSTPIGSTAYSLSAGGSILTHNLDAFIFTPINAHMYSDKSIVYRDSSTLRISLTDRGCATLYVDGVRKETLENGDDLYVSKFIKTLKIFDNNSGFFNKLQNGIIK